MKSVGAILAGGIIIILCGGLIMLGDMKVRPAAGRAQSLNTLHQIGLAMNSYHDLHGHFPAAAIRDKDGRPLLSWRVALLPFLEADDLYREFHQDEEWDSPHNSRLLNRMPGAFRSPRNGPDDSGATYYQVFTGDGAVFENPTGLTRDEIRNGRGLDNTLLVVEGAEAVSWTRPVDLVNASGQPLPRLGGRFMENQVWEASTTSAPSSPTAPPATSPRTMTIPSARSFPGKGKGWQRLIIEGTRCVLEKGIGLVPRRHDGRDLQQDIPLAGVIGNCSPPHCQIPGVVGGVLRRLKSLN